MGGADGRSHEGQLVEHVFNDILPNPLYQTIHEKRLVGRRVFRLLYLALALVLVLFIGLAPLIVVVDAVDFDGVLLDQPVEGRLDDERHALVAALLRDDDERLAPPGEGHEPSLVDYVTRR